MFARLAAFAERRAVWIVAGWLAAAAVLTLTAPSLQQVGTQDETAFLPASSPSQRADRILRRLFPDDPTLDAGIVVLSREGKLTAGDRAYIGRLAGWLRRAPVAKEVETVQSAASDPALAPMLRAPDGSAELVVVGFRAPPFASETIDAVERLRRHLDATAPPGLEHHVTGTAGLAADQASGIVRSFERTAIITVLLVLVILVFVYRSAVAPLIPLATIGVAFLVARGVIGLMAERGFEVASLAETFIVVMIFGAGTDYCLFVVSRYREDLAGGRPLPVALRRTMTVVGGVIAASAATVIVGFLSQGTARFGMYRTMGPAMGVAIFVTLIAGLTLTPALLRLAGRRAFWPAALHDARADARSARWERLARVVRRRPAEVLLAGVTVLLLPAAGLGWFRESFDIVRELPPSADARAGFDALAAHYPPGMLAPVYLVVDADGPITDGARLAALDHLTDVLRRQAGVGEVRSLTQPAGVPLTAETVARLGDGSGLAAGLDAGKVDVGPLLSALSSPGGLRFTGPILERYPQLLDGPLSLFVGEGGRSTRIVVALDGNPYDRDAMPVIRRLDDATDAALAGTALSGARLAVGGPASFFVDMQDIGRSDFRVITAVLIGGIFCVLALLLRSVVAPFYLLASVVLSYAATLGLCAFVFVALLGDPGISFWLPPFLFVILVALGADYNIFIMSRIREEADGGAEVHDAVARGTVATGHVITSAGLILAGTFAVLVAAPLPQLRQIGFAVTVGVLVDTFVVRSLIVPAATMLLGRWAFWPAFPGERAVQALRPRPVGVAAGGVAALAVALVALATTAEVARSIERVSGRGTAATAGRGEVASPPAGAAAPDAPDAQPPEPPAVPIAEMLRTVDVSRPPTPTRPPTSATATGATPPAAATAQLVSLTPGRIAVPEPGAWHYRVEGTRAIGVAVLAQPFAEDATTEVTRVGGTNDSPEVRLQRDGSAGSQDERRRYGPNSVELLAVRVDAAGMSYGGTLQPPQTLVRWPPRVGDRWDGDWTAGSVEGRTTTAVTGTRRVDVAGRAWQCWVIQTDTTLTGSVQGTQHHRACWVPELGMSVDDDQQFRGTYNGIPFEVKSRAILLATP